MRWIAEPTPPAVKEIEQAKRSAEKSALQVKGLKEQLVVAHRARSSAEKALAVAENALSELKASRSAEARTRDQGEAAQLAALRTPATKSMPCSLSSNKQRMAQELKDCVEAFDRLNR